MKRKTVIGLLAVALVAGGLLTLRAARSSSPSATSAKAAGGALPWLRATNPPAAQAPDASGVPAADQQKLQAAYARLSPAEQQTVARTTAYVGFMERMRGILEAPQPVRLSPREANELTAQVDGFQQENYFSISQAFDMKAALLRDAYQGIELEQRLATLQEAASRQYEALKAQSDPNKDPTFRAFKAEQQAMIEQARQMNSFPQGLSRDQYIIQESERIRARHYKD
ncbi:MAG: hypothetical protein QM749_15260 [Aquabacterium sp.]